MNTPFFSPAPHLTIALILAACCMPGNAYALSAGKETPLQTENTSAQDRKFDAHEQFVQLHFADHEMDFAFQWILSAASNKGSEIGEAFYTAGKIKNGDAQSWQDEWKNMAGRVELRANRSLAAGHIVSARQQYMRAANYYRASIISMLPDNQNFLLNAFKSRGLLIKAGKLFDPPLEHIEIPFEDTVLPGYFRKADKTGTPSRTLIMIGGGETFAEDLVFYIAPQAFAHGYNFLTVDLPGQGIMPTEGKPFRAEMEGPMKAVVDYALSRPEVDPEKLAAYGISGGGYFVPRAAMFDKRLKAIAVNSAVVDDHRLFASMPVATATPDVVRSWSSFKRGTIQAIAWRWAVAPDNIPGLVKANEGYQFDPARVACPVLILIGEGEYQNEEVRRQQHECLDNLPNPRKKLVVTPADEGASSHCIGENRSLMSQVVFDWFDEIFK